MKNSKRVVIKVGTKVISPDGLGLSRLVINNLSRQIAELMDKNIEVILVSSGAVAAGRPTIAFPRVAKKSKWWPSISEEQINHKQLLASIGQAEMIMAWKSAFGILGYGVAQAVVTNQEFSNLVYARELANNINKLLMLNIIPVVNENDLLTKAEFLNNFSDNDELMLLVAKLLRAQTIICLMDCDGYYEDGKLLKELTGVEKCKAPANLLTRGGMKGKLERCHQAMGSGIDVFLANGWGENVLRQIIIDKLNPGTRGMGRRGINS